MKNQEQGQWGKPQADPWMNKDSWKNSWNNEEKEEKDEWGRPQADPWIKKQKSKWAMQERDAWMKPAYS